MYVKWIGADVCVGPGRMVRAISTGDVRKVRSYKGDQFVLESADGAGSFGWCDAKNLEIVSPPQEKHLAGHKYMMDRYRGVNFTVDMHDIAATKHKTRSRDMGNIRINVENLKRMANKNLNEELEAAGAMGLPKDIHAALLEQIAEENKNAAKSAASEILALIKLHDKGVSMFVNEIRDVRRRETKLKAELAKFNRAKQYGMETSNFLPLAEALGCIGNFSVPVEDRKLLSVPEDWTPSETNPYKEEAK